MPLAGKVLIVVENLPVPFDRRVWMEATTLHKAGYQVSVICPTGKGYEAPYEEVEGIHIYRHPLPPEQSSAVGYLKEYVWALTWEFRLARRVWKERGFDLVHICNPPDLLFIVALWYKLFHRVRVIFDQHDLNPEMYETKFGRRDIFYHGLRWAERLTFATADFVISTNESYREVALTRGRKAPHRVTVVRSGPDLSRFRPTAPQIGLKRGCRFLVGYVGVMGEQEGIDHLLRAIHHIVKDCGRSDIHFVLVGDGPARANLESLTRTLGLEGHVEFTGRIPDPDLLAILSTCDVCVNPDPKTPFNDRSTMNKILEYMAMSKPIVQFDLLEGRRSAENASLYARPDDDVDFATKILDLLDAPQLRHEMGRIGRTRMVETLEWRHQMPRLLQTYADAFGTTKQSGASAKGS